MSELKKGGCRSKAVDINFLNYPLMVKLRGESSQTQRKPKQKYNLGMNSTSSFFLNTKNTSPENLSKNKQKGSIRVKSRRLKNTSPENLSKNKQKGSIRVKSRRLTRGPGHELLKLIPDVRELSAMSSRFYGRPTRSRSFLQDCKIALFNVARQSKHLSPEISGAFSDLFDNLFNAVAIPS